MNYLLDTHILLWWLSEPKKLTSPVFEVISNPTNEIFVSAVSAWEIAIKKGLKKLKAPKDLIQMLASKDLKQLPILFEHTLAVEKLKPFHNDPFDRLLIAQAKYEKMTIITADKWIPKYKISSLTNTVTK